MFNFPDLPRVLRFMGFDNKDFKVCDDNDGNGPYIKSWSANKTEPTKRQIVAAYKRMNKDK